MKIKNVYTNYIEFDDGSTITYDHRQDCCEHNYADFSQLEDLALNYNFTRDQLVFESIRGVGFRFGDNPLAMFFVPCYSSQNGYYTSSIEIYYNHKQVLSFGANLILE